VTHLFPATAVLAEADPKAPAGLGLDVLPMEVVDVR
jgi:hypothetical protein